MALVFQLAKIRYVNDPDNPQATLEFLSVGDESDTNVISAANAVVPVQYTGNPAGQSAQVPLQNYEMEHQGGGVWKITAQYNPRPPLATGLTVWDCDFTGGTEKIYQSIQQAGVQVPGYTLPQLFGAIGVSKDSVEGVDITVPKGLLTAKRKFVGPNFGGSIIPPNYLKMLRLMVGTTNDVAFDFTFLGLDITQDIGEVLFLGATVTQQTETEVQIDHKFAVSDNASNSNNNLIYLQVAPGTPPGNQVAVAKGGWEYLWIQYADAASNGQRIRVPVAIFVEQVYPAGGQGNVPSWAIFGSQYTSGSETYPGSLTNS